MSTRPAPSISATIPASARIAIIASRFNSEIVEELLRGCLGELTDMGIGSERVSIHRVPGAFELPLAAKLAARTRQFSAVICLGAVIRGETPHFDYVAGEAARGIQQVMLDEALPVIFGVLTTDTEEQARQRIGGAHGHAGKRAAEAAVEMIALANQLHSS
jgi:6,7-dimethyl-8-ribityllumazine synthase